VGDFKGDSNPDLAVTNPSSDTVSVLPGGAGGSFGAPTNFAAGDAPDTIADRPARLLLDAGGAISRREYLRLAARR